MVATPVAVGLAHMLQDFGWKAGNGIVAATLIIFLRFRAELRALKAKDRGASSGSDEKIRPYPLGNRHHLAFLALIVAAAHYLFCFIALFCSSWRSRRDRPPEPDRPEAADVGGIFLAGWSFRGLQGW